MAADDCSDRGALLEDNKARVHRYVEEFQSAGNVTRSSLDEATMPSPTAT